MAVATQVEPAPQALMNYVLDQLPLSGCIIIELTHDNNVPIVLVRTGDGVAAPLELDASIFFAKESVDTDILNV